ncbi:MAG: ATP-dependent RNA helicase DbpA [Gammaproteobacteria bacterium]|nr:ATP-dependent RNA helicase DbpA [Gammaproteobacteria bacterium]
MSDPAPFDTLDLKPELLSNLGHLGYTGMTLVQAQTLPKLIAGADVLARAKTGSGKTAAFGLSLLNRLNPALFQVQALVLCPTRELADQVSREIRRLARGIANIKILSLCGGVPFGPQVGSLQHSPHVIVGTPGRVLKHLGKATVNLKNLQTLVLDEADRMLDMGFTDELDAILQYVPAKRQTLLFSATYPPAIAEISARVQRKPLTVDVTDDEQPAPIVQHWCPVTRENRCDELIRALRAWGGALNLVFCNTKVDCAEVAKSLRAKNIVALALHGDLDQPRRTEVLVRFANRSASVLIATDVAARGLDVKDIDAVFNYELPRQAEVYIHRIGRTGRAGKTGVAVSLVEPREMWRLEAISKTLPDATLQQRNIPDAPRSTDSLAPAMTTIQINGGRKNKLRPGDLLGALTADGGVPGDSVGVIDLYDNFSYVAVRNAQAPRAQRQLASRPIKGREYRARIRK